MKYPIGHKIGDWELFSYADGSYRAKRWTDRGWEFRSITEQTLDRWSDPLMDLLEKVEMNYDLRKDIRYMERQCRHVINLNLALTSELDDLRKKLKDE